MIKDKLTQLGLTNNEAKTYLYLLDSFKAKASEVSKYLDVTHPAAKKILDSLIIKGLIRLNEYGKAVFYFPEESSKLIEFVNQNARKIEEEQHRKIALAEETNNLIKSKSSLEKETKTNIRFYKGKEGIEQLAQEIVNSKEKVVYEFIDLDLALYTKLKDKTDYIKKYQEKGIRFDIVYTSLKGIYPTGLEIDKIRISKDRIDSPTAHMLIFDDKVSFSFITDDKAIVIIENQWIVNTLLALFKNLKQELKKAPNGAI